MSDRPRGYGMTAEVSDKIQGKYSPELEREAREWMGDVIGETVEGPIQDSCKDGRILCKLINVLQPGSVKKINESKMAFKQMENIGNFLDACVTYGVPKTDLFQTVDLFEAQNIPQVVNGIHAVGRKAGKKGFNGPTIGPKEAAANKRDFTDEQLKAGQNVIGLQMGSNKGASQTGMSYGAPRQIHDPTA
ncbi:muscle-specific protein 20-like [Halichondria panicea]|uniref:muscle-specific protein 20-like n=1 Tax=Halichondria panicea TaxID=6063 RepID=UPI00312B489A